MTYKGASINYVRKIFGILDPLPPLCSHFTQPISTVIRKFGQFLNPLPPSRCERNKWIAPNAITTTAIAAAVRLGK